MNKLIIAFILFSVSLFAREELFPTQECPAFNNMKHTKNTHSVHLDIQQKYMILKHHKGQNLILIKGEQPAQRWVDDKCFSKRNISSNSANVEKVKSRVISIGEELSQSTISTDLTRHTKKYKVKNTNKYEKRNISKRNLLTLSWHNAFCETHRYKKECKRSMFSFGRPNYSEKHFVLHGLWPQPKNKVYCDVNSKVVTLDKHKQWNRLPNLELSDEVQKRLQRVMPGFSSNLHKHEWIKHGTCYGTDANKYYEDAISMVEQVNDSKVGDFFKKHIGKRVTLHQIRAVFDRNFGVGTGKRIALKCRKGLITEIWLHLGSGSDDLGTLLKRGKQTRSHCQGGFIDKAGF